MAREQRQGGGTELGHLLYPRRTQVIPADFGLVQGAGVRRTPGLRDSYADRDNQIRGCVARRLRRPSAPP